MPDEITPLSKTAADSSVPSSLLAAPPPPELLLPPPPLRAAESERIGLFWPPSSGTAAADTETGAAGAALTLAGFFLDGDAGSSNSGSLRPVGCSRRRRPPPPPPVARPEAVALGVSVASSGPTRSSCAWVRASTSNGEPESRDSQQPSSGWHAPPAPAHDAASAHWQLRRDAAHAWSAPTARE
jgi:hypothetical protein